MSTLSIGIVGLPNVGKSTLFNALTKRSVPAANYPFCTIDPSVGIVPVPDARLDALAALSHSERTIPAVVEFVDIAGLVAGASKGEGLGNTFLSHIREVDAILEVVRVFEGTDVVHVAGRVDPLGDIAVINLELVLADLQTLQKRLGSLEREARAGVKGASEERAVLETLVRACDEGKLLRSVVLDEEEAARIAYLNLLSRKPIVYALNGTGGEVPEPLEQFFAENDSRFVRVNARAEEEMKDLDPAERADFRAELGAEESDTAGVIVAGYAALDLITFFTTGEDETRGWTTARGSFAPEAGRAIHSDFHDKFIRAEVVACEDLLAAGSYANARERGLVRTEGKSYLVQDGDVVEFRI